MNSKWVYRKSDGQFLYGGFHEAQPPAIGTGKNVAPDFTNYGVVEFPDADPHPDIRLHRFDAVTGKRAATAQELQAYDDAKKDDQAAAMMANPIVAACIEAMADLTGKTKGETEAKVLGKLKLKI